MAKSRFDTSFDFGANVKPKKTPSTGKKGRRGKRQLTAAQRATAMYYIKPRRR